MAAPKRKVRHKAPRKQFLTLDHLAAFIQDAMRSGAHGGEDIHFAHHPWNDGLRRVRVDVDVTPTTAEHPVSIYVETPADAAEALRRHYSPHDVLELARLLTTGASPARKPRRSQSSAIKRTTVVEYKAQHKRTLTLDELAAFVQQARRLGAGGNQFVDADAEIVGCGLKQVCVKAKTRRAHLPVTVRLESPAKTATALRSHFSPRDLSELARLLAASDLVAFAPPSPADRVGGQSRDRSLVEGRPMTTRKVRVEHETVLTLSLDDVTVFIRDAKRVGACGDEIVRAATPPRYHGQTLWNLSVEVDLPPVDRLVRTVHTDRLTQAVEALRRNLSPDDVLRVARLLAADGDPTDAPTDAPRPQAAGAARSWDPDPDPDEGGEELMTTRKAKIEHHAPGRGRLTLKDVAGFIRDATQAGAHGDEIVRDPSRNWQLASLSVEVDVAPADRLVRNVHVDRTAATARALRRTFAPHDVRELARLLASDDPHT